MRFDGLQGAYNDCKPAVNGLGAVVTKSTRCLSRASETAALGPGEYSVSYFSHSARSFCCETFLARLTDRSAVLVAGVNRGDVSTLRCFMAGGVVGERAPKFLLGYRIRLLKLGGAHL